MTRQRSPYGYENTIILYLSEYHRDNQVISEMIEQIIGFV